MKEVSIALTILFMVCVDFNVPARAGLVLTPTPIISPAPTPSPGNPCDCETKADDMSRVSKN